MSQNRNPKVVEEAKERDDFTCQKCGLQDPSTVEGHHIEPLPVGGIDAVENVSTLCDYCHDFAPTNIQPTDFEAVFQIYVSTGLTPDHDLLLFGSMLHSDMDSHQQVAESLHYLYDNSLTMPNASLDMRWIQASRKVDYRGIREYFPKGSKCGVHGMDTELSRQAILQRVDDPDCYHGEPPKGLTYADDNRTLIVDADEREEFETAMDVIRLRDEGKTYTEIIEETDLARSRVSRILNRQTKWFERADALDESDLETSADRSPENIA